MGSIQMASSEGLRGTVRPSVLASMVAGSILVDSSGQQRCRCVVPVQHRGQQRCGLLLCATHCDRQALSWGHRVSEASFNDLLKVL